MKELYDQILHHWQLGGSIMIVTAYKAWILGPDKSAMLKLSANQRDLFMRRGRRWDCVTYCAFRFSRINNQTEA